MNSSAMPRRSFFYLFLLIFALFFIFCSSNEKGDKKMASKYLSGTFGYDLAFLQSKGDMVVLKDNTAKSQVIVSPQYQGKVFTSTAGGLSGKSFGWINYKLFQSGKIQPHINAYGGEDRLWLGPEGGQFSIFFKPGTKMVFDNWFTPGIIDTAVFDLISKTDTSIIMEKSGHLTSYAGTQFDFQLKREIDLLPIQTVEKDLNITVPNGIRVVGFQSKNTLTNIGSAAWTPKKGTLCIWILGMYRPSEKATVAIPFVQGDEKKLGKIVTTDYFGKITPDRLKIENGVIFFKADGRKRCKLGVPPKRAKSVVGSYDAENGVLTIIQFNKPEGISNYINQLWKIQENPFEGDVVNSYNDGPLEDGSQIGPFYELETSSPAAFLSSGESIIHVHRTFHFVGDELQLGQISKAVLGVDVQVIRSVFK